MTTSLAPMPSPASPTSPPSPASPEPTPSIAPRPPVGDPRRRLAVLLDRQAGVVSRRQALGIGLDARDVDRYVVRRRWRPVHPRVYLVGHPMTDEARVRAAALWAGDGAVIVGTAALWWHGLVPHPPPVVAVAVSRRGPAPRPGIAVHRRVLAHRDLVDVRGLRVPVRPLALLDAAVEAGADGAALLRRALGCRTPGVGLAQLHALTGRAAGPATALRLMRSLADVTSAPRPDLAEWRGSRNRYS